MASTYWLLIWTTVLLTTASTQGKLSIICTLIYSDNIHMVESTQNESYSYRVAVREVERQPLSEKHAYCNYPEVL